jgi:hypothetical protein
MSQCRACGVILTRPSQKVFCNNACQRSEERGKKTAAWLATGRAVIAGQKDHYVRRHILEEQDACCAICGIADLWNDQELVLVLDHIDGNATNNRRDNLRLICPNCDSQLPTFKSRNRGNGRHYRRQRYADGKSY